MCGVAVYPAGVTCPRCGSQMDERRLSPRGVLWTWTVQRYPPKSPPFVPRSDPFEPFAVGYVELPEGVRVEALLEVGDLTELEIGMPMALVEGGGVPRFAPDPSTP